MVEILGGVAVVAVVVIVLHENYLVFFELSCVVFVSVSDLLVALVVVDGSGIGLHYVAFGLS